MRCSRLYVVVTFLLVANFGVGASADVLTWVGSDGNWFDPANWNPPTRTRSRF